MVILLAERPTSIQGASAGPSECPKDPNGFSLGGTWGGRHGIGTAWGVRTLQRLRPGLRPLSDSLRAGRIIRARATNPSSTFRRFHSGSPSDPSHLVPAPGRWKRVATGVACIRPRAMR